MASSSSHPSARQPLVRPERDPDVSRCLSGLRSQSLFAPDQPARAEIPRLWGELYTRWWGVVRQPGNLPKDWPAFVRAQLDAGTLETTLMAVYGEDMQAIRGHHSRELLPKFKRVVALLGMHHDYLSFLDLGPAVPRAITALRALISVLKPKRGAAVPPAVLLSRLRDEMLGRCGRREEPPVLEIRDVNAVVRALKQQGPDAEASVQVGKEEAAAAEEEASVQNANGKRPRADEPGDGERHVRPRRHEEDREADDEHEREDSVEDARGRGRQAGADDHVDLDLYPSLLDASRSGSSGPPDPEHQDEAEEEAEPEEDLRSAGTERRDEYLRVLTMTANLPAPVPGEDGYALAALISAARMQALGIVRALEDFRDI